MSGWARRPRPGRDGSTAWIGRSSGGAEIGLLVAGILLMLGGIVLWTVRADRSDTGDEGASAFLREARHDARDRQADDGTFRISVLKTRTCGCCSAWVGHLRESGFEVEVRDVAPGELLAAKEELGIAPELRSCHTAVAGAYLFEGHVPADLVRRVLEQRPAIEGLAVPGMPVGSPGMEGANPEPYDVLALLPDGETVIYAHR